MKLLSKKFLADALESKVDANGLFLLLKEHCLS